MLGSRFRAVRPLARSSTPARSAQSPLRAPRSGREPLAGAREPRLGARLGEETRRRRRRCAPARRDGRPGRGPPEPPGRAVRLRPRPPRGVRGSKRHSHVPSRRRCSAHDSKTSSQERAVSGSPARIAASIRSSAPQKTAIVLEISRQCLSASSARPSPSSSNASAQCASSRTIPSRRAEASSRLSAASVRLSSSDPARPRSRRA